MKVFSKGDRVQLVVKYPPLSVGFAGTVINTKAGNFSFGERSWYVEVIFDSGHRIKKLHQGFFILEYPPTRRE